MPSGLTTRLEGATTAATQELGRGRLVADGGAYRAGVALFDLASGTVDDFDMQGSWGLDSTTEETYLNWYFRCTVNAATGSPSACYTIELDTTQNKIGLWEIDAGGSYSAVIQSVAACGLNDNVRHGFRLRVEGGHIEMWYWDDGGSPPGSPQIDYTDGTPSFTTGQLLLGRWNGADGVSRYCDFDDLFVATLWNPIPQNLSLVSKTDTQIDLEWDAVAGATGYDIERNGIVIATSVAGTTYSDTGLSASTEYTHRVRSVFT